ncbi:MAG TPA: mycofactocin biosynthesis glycosyltransferase MftF [Ilumatobacter sp.]
MTGPRRYRLDATVQRFGTVVIGGSPLKLFRLTEAGAALVEQIAAGAAVPDSALVTTLLAAGAVHPVVEPAAARPGRATATDVTIVVPTFGPPGHVPAGAILVDDGSTPPVPGARVRFDRNRGPAAARNAGLADVDTDFVAFVDADVELADGWLDPLLAHFDDERVALVAPRVRAAPPPSGSPAGPWFAGYELANGPLDLGPEPARVLAGTRVSYVPAATIVCRTAAVRSVGGFDETLRFGEDVDLVWRLAAAGWVCRYEPAGEVRHAMRADLAAWVRQRIGYGSSAAALARRHPGALAPLRMSGWSLGAWTLGALGRPLLGTAVGVGSAAALVRKLPDVPPRAALRLAGLGNLRAGEGIAAAIRRAWWPLLAVAAWRSRAARRLLLAAAVSARHPLRVADDVAYSVGVWRGMWAERTIAPLVPEITSWPGRSAVTVAAPRS